MTSGHEPQPSATEAALEAGRRVVDDVIDISALDSSPRKDITDHEADSAVKLGEPERLLFARQILLCLGLLVLLVILGYGFSPCNRDAWEAMFEVVKIGALPLVTLIIGFYFPSSK